MPTEYLELQMCNTISSLFVGIGLTDFLPTTTILFISISWEAEIIDVPHHLSPFSLVFKNFYLSQVLVAHTCNPSSVGAEIGRIVVQGQLGQSLWDPHLQNNQSKMDWRCSSSSRVPAL
jgi:hypothetical protein